MVQYSALMHEVQDDVAVAIVNLASGDKVKVTTVNGKEIGTIKAIESIPLGHKISMRNIAKNSKVIEYGYPIGKATQAIRKGAHVHIHNIKSIRWA